MQELTEAEQLFYDHAGWSYNPSKETAEEGRRRCARELAEAEEWAKREGITFDWAEDWGVGNHRDFYGEDSAYADREPETCEQVVARRGATVLASLGCVDDATNEYRRVIEAELADEARG